MINRYPLWKNLFIVAVLVLGLVYALPNLFGEDPALQIAPASSSVTFEGLEERVKTLLEQADIPHARSEVNPSGLLVRFADTETQLNAKEVISQGLGPEYTVALNLAPATPGWLRSIGAQPMYLGLDLRGGVHFLMDIDMDEAVATAEERYVSDFRSLLRKEKVRYRSVVRRVSGGVEVSFANAQARDRAADLIRNEYRELEVTKMDKGDKFLLLAKPTEQHLAQTRKLALQQNITTLRNRVNELGVAEPVIQQQGDNRIVVQLPGVQDTARAKEILGATATLEFRAVDEQHDLQSALEGKVPATSRIYRERDGRPWLLKKQVIVTGDQLTDAASGIDQQSGSPAVYVTLDGKGGRKMGEFTKHNVGKGMAVVFIENKTGTQVKDGKEVKTTRKVEEIISVAMVRGVFSKRFQITGLDSTKEARDLALLLRAGSLAAPMRIVEERTVGPSLGQDNIDQGFRSVIIGFVLVLSFMAVWYRLFGLVADLALAMNLVLIVALLSLLQATLTLPGIAGIVLTVGMAVDANVLIFERIREEIRAGNTPQASIHAGYEKAFSTIADANITTLIAAIVLFSFGTGPIKGFAVTLSLGIITSMFTAILGTRAVINLIYGGRRVTQLAI
jgi:preprotein translocase subunit SecD